MLWCNLSWDVICWRTACLKTCKIHTWAARNGYFNQIRYGCQLNKSFVCALEFLSDGKSSDVLIALLISPSHYLHFFIFAPNQIMQSYSSNFRTHSQFFMNLVLQNNENDCCYSIYAFAWMPSGKRLARCAIEKNATTRSFKLRCDHATHHCISAKHWLTEWHFLPLN